MDACLQVEIKLHLTILDENDGITCLENFASERDIKRLTWRRVTVGLGLPAGGTIFWRIVGLWRLVSPSKLGSACGGTAMPEATSSVQSRGLCTHLGLGPGDTLGPGR